MQQPPRLGGKTWGLLGVLRGRVYPQVYALSSEGQRTAAILSTAGRRRSCSLVPDSNRITVE